MKAQQLKVAMFAQHQLDDLRPEETPVDHVRQLMLGAMTESSRLRGPNGSRHGPHGHQGKGFVRWGKARLLLGLISFDGPNLLILDEPTNHLDDVNPLMHR
ncbi:MAG: hypothetical protein R3D29_12730 [Nitratireductor sp.]